MAILGGACWMWQTRATSAKTQPSAKPTITAEPRELGSIGMPDPAQLVRHYQGPIEQADGRKLCLYLDIRSAEMRNDRVAFQYFMNSPTQSVKGDGEVGADGSIRFDGFRGRVVMQNDAIVVRSAGIDGPPYWRLVGHNKRTR